MSLVREIEDLIAEAAKNFESCVSSAGHTNIKSELTNLRARVLDSLNQSKDFSKTNPIIASLACSCALASGLQQELVNVSKAVVGEAELPQELRHKCVDFWAKVQSQRVLLIQTVETLVAGKNLAGAKARLETVRDSIEQTLLELNTEFQRLSEFSGAKNSSALRNSGAQVSSEGLREVGTLFRGEEFQLIRGAVAAQVAELA